MNTVVLLPPLVHNDAYVILVIVIATMVRDGQRCVDRTMNMHPTHARVVRLTLAIDDTYHLCISNALRIPTEWVSVV